MLELLVESVVDNPEMSKAIFKSMESESAYQTPRWPWRLPERNFHHFSWESQVA
ncbi:MAG: hypothetical protein ETSY1_20940 [Candidatus Entotheonella factor]|uniref:Uncharacterized protein n=1 Tax=Entotheonella factor TaxID=1429438 RepID=W4LIV1_ENTF1|nr:MAG: hypothetical protein ETSY1_20940 [Candidatus Entotheonella factor]